MDAAVVTGAFALGGVALTMLSQGVATVAARRDAAKARWHERRHQAHWSFARNLDTWIQQFRVARDDPHALSKETLRDQGKEAFAYLCELELIASEKCVWTAALAFDAAAKLYAKITEGDEVTNAVFDSATTERDAYIHAAREELGTNR